MHRQRAAVDCLGLVMVLAAVWSMTDSSGVRSGDRVFVFDPGARRGYVTTVINGESCPLVGIPVAEAPVRRSACGRACAEAAGARSRSCGSRSGSCFYFPLGQTAYHTVDPLELGDDGLARGRTDVQNRPATSRPIRPPIPPPRTS